jgi:hypothetical protein
MPNTGLYGPCRLTETTIDQHFTKTGPGTYVLGHTNDRNVFVVEYVGRSDDDLNHRLKDWVGDYYHFKASYFEAARDAFDKECEIYHNFGESRVLDNDIHPARPSGTSWRCPVCGA